MFLKQFVLFLVKMVDFREKWLIINLFSKMVYLIKKCRRSPHLSKTQYFSQTVGFG